MPKTFSEKRFSRLISSMFRETKIYVNAFKKKDFFEIFFSWVPDFYKDFKELSDRSKTDYVNYTTGSAGKLIRFIPSLDGDFIPVKDNGRLVVYDGVYDRTQRDAAREAIYDFYRMHGHENVMREVINAALATINELSIPDPVSSEAENLFSVDERENSARHTIILNHVLTMVLNQLTYLASYPGIHSVVVIIIQPVIDQNQTCILHQRKS